MVGIVVTISPSFSLYRMVVFPAASSPTIRILISRLAKRRSKSFVKVRPMARGGEGNGRWRWMALHPPFLGSLSAYLPAYLPVLKSKP